MFCNKDELQFWIKLDVYNLIHPRSFSGLRNLLENPGKSTGKFFPAWWSNGSSRGAGVEAADQPRRGGFVANWGPLEWNVYWKV